MMMDFIEGEDRVPTLLENVFYDVENRYSFAFENTVSFFFNSLI